MLWIFLFVVVYAAIIAWWLACGQKPKIVPSESKRKEVADVGEQLMATIADRGAFEVVGRKTPDGDYVVNVYHDFVTAPIVTATIYRDLPAARRIEIFLGERRKEDLYPDDLEEALEVIRGQMAFFGQSLIWSSLRREEGV